MSSLFPWILLISAVNQLHGANYRATTENLNKYLDNEFNMTASDLDCPGDKRCGCDSMYDFNISTSSCELSRHATGEMVEKHNTEDWLKQQSDLVFSGAIVAAFLFITLAGACTFAGCIYCCHMKRSDAKLKNQLKEMAAKTGTKLSLHPQRSPQKQQDACSIIMEESTIMCA